MKQVAAALEYMHQPIHGGPFSPHPVLHRDLKPANILLVDHYRIVKVADFDMATFQRTEMTNARGTYLYMAPEVKAQVNTVVFLTNYHR
jgi:serine/threonine protein kinase